MFKKKYLKRISKDKEFQNYCKHTQPKSQKDLDIEIRNNLLSNKEPQEPCLENDYTYEEYRNRKGLADLNIDRFRDSVIQDKINIW